METIAGPGLFREMQLPVRHEGGAQIRNLATGRWLVLTPEEAVRQGLLAWMVQRGGYPKAMISTERAIRLGRMLKRFDVVVLGRDAESFLLVECKAPSVPLSPAVAEQAARYNTQLRAKYLLITNGLDAECYRFTPQGYERMAEWLPGYE